MFYVLIRSSTTKDSLDLSESELNPEDSYCGLKTKSVLTLRLENISAKHFTRIDDSGAF